MRRGGTAANSCCAGQACYSRAAAGPHLALRGWQAVIMPSGRGGRAIMPVGGTPAPERLWDR